MNLYTRFLAQRVFASPIAAEQLPPATETEPADLPTPRTTAPRPQQSCTYTANPATLPTQRPTAPRPTNPAPASPSLAARRGRAFDRGTYRLFIRGRSPKPPAPVVDTTSISTSAPSHIHAIAATANPPRSPATPPSHSNAIVTAATLETTDHTRLVAKPSHHATAAASTAPRSPLSTPAPQHHDTTSGAPVVLLPPVRTADALPGLGPDCGGFVHRVITWPLAPAITPRPALLGGAFAHVRLPTAAALAPLCRHWGLPCDPSSEAGSPLLFLDVETTALDRGAGALAFMVGVAGFVAGHLHIEQWILTKLSHESVMLAAMLARLNQLASDNAILCSFNGASFDVPLLRTRLAHVGLPTAAFERPHLDLLPPARRLWRGRSPDCRLATLERTQLGIRRIHDIPGSEIPAVFWAWLRATANPDVRTVMTRVADHNAADLITLPAVAAALATAISQPSDLDMRVRVAEFHRAHGRKTQALATLAPMAHDRNLAGASPTLRRRALSLHAELLSRDPQTRDQAASVWAKVCQLAPGDPHAHEALAKHLEHHAKDLAKALQVAEASATPCPHRLARLHRRLLAHEQPS